MTVEVQRSGGGSYGKVRVTSPIPLVRPSLNTSRLPGRMYSGRLMKRKVTTALSFVRKQLCKSKHSLKSVLVAHKCFFKISFLPRKLRSWKVSFGLKGWLFARWFFSRFTTQNRSRQSTSSSQETQILA